MARGDDAAGTRDPLIAIADDLHAMPPAEFVAQRNARAAEHRADRDLATRIKGLRRPAPAAWVVTLLVRETPDDLEELFEVGAESRAAQAALDRAAMTRLAGRRRALVNDLVHRGSELATAAGHPITSAVSYGVAATLEAGAADPEAAAAIRTGRLLRALESIGFEPVDLAEAVAVPAPGSPAADARPERTRPRAIDDPDAELARARRLADESAEEAAQRADDTARELADLRDRAPELERRRAALEDEIADLGERLQEAKHTLGAVEREDRALRRELDKAKLAAQRAEDAARTAAARRDQLH